MKEILIFSKCDFQTTFRDPLFKMLLFFPLISFVIIRFVLPALIIRYPVIEEYAVVILMWACLQTASMFGIIYGFLFLEEKEESVWQVLKVLPISASQLIFSRLLLGLLISVLINYLLIHFGNIIFIPLWQEIFLAIQYSLAAPLIALLVGVYSKNRIEGMAQIKIINLLLIIPALIYFIPGVWIHFTAFVPTYWSYRSMEMTGNIADFLMYTSAGFLFYFTCIMILQRKLFNIV